MSMLHTIWYILEIWYKKGSSIKQRPDILLNITKTVAYNINTYEIYKQSSRILSIYDIYSLRWEISNKINIFINDFFN